MPRPFDPYVTLRTEPDLRQEFFNTMDGRYPEVSKKQRFVHRKIRAEDGGLVNCPCKDPLTNEPDKDAYCPICLGEGFLWDEVPADGYKVVLGGNVMGATRGSLISSGTVNLQNASFYFRYNLDLNLPPLRVEIGRTFRNLDICPDKIVELITADDGSPVRPYQRQRIFRIGTMIDFRADGGRLEYWKLDCYEEQVRFMNGPGG